VGVFSQTNDVWKNKRLYTAMWLGYGTGFSMGIQADIQLFKYFSVGIDTGLSDKLFPTISLFPKVVFRPWEIEISIFGGPKIGYHRNYGGLWGIVYGADIGYHLGPGVLYGTFHTGMNYAFGLGYRIGFIDRRK
jgi:hypothetical protein